MSIFRSRNPFGLTNCASSRYIAFIPNISLLNRTTRRNASPMFRLDPTRPRRRSIEVAGLSQALPPAVAADDLDAWEDWARTKSSPITFQKRCKRNRKTSM